MNKILNTTLEKARERLSNRKIQRLSIDLSCETNLELLIIPLGEKWEINRMTGTDKNYCAIGILGYGFYPFKLDGYISTGYLATKLNLPFMVAEDLTDLLNKINIEFYEEKE